MIEHHYFPDVIDAHRNDLRSLVAPLPIGVTIPTWRARIGRQLIRLGRWLEGRRQETGTGIPASQASVT